MMVGLFVCVVSMLLFCVVVGLGVDYWCDVFLFVVVFGFGLMFMVVFFMMVVFMLVFVWYVGLVFGVNNVVVCIGGFLVVVVFLFVVGLGECIYCDVFVFDYGFD